MRLTLTLAMLLALPALLLLAAPEKNEKPAERVVNPLVITEADQGKTLNTHVGAAIEIRLIGDQERTGWEGGTAKGAVERLGAKPGEVNASPTPEFTPSANARDDSMGTYVFRYRAVAAGTTEIRFVYVYPGGPKGVPRSATKLVREMKVKVEVQ